MHPIGFSPCGTAFGALRKPYSADCNFFADDEEYTNRIQWYIVPDDRDVYELPTVFFPRVDDHDGTGPSPFERTGPGRIVRRFAAGLDWWGYLGDHVDGTEDDFLGRSNAAKYVVDGEGPFNPCAGIPPCRFFLAMGFKARSAICDCKFLGDHYPDLHFRSFSPDCPEYLPWENDIVVQHPYPPTSWLETFPPPMGDVIVLITCNDVTHPCSLSVTLVWYEEGFGPDLVHVLAFDPPTIYSCEPLIFDAQAIGLEGHALGKKFRFLIGLPFPPPIGESKFGLRLAFKGVFAEGASFPLAIGFSADTDGPFPELCLFGLRIGFRADETSNWIGTEAGDAITTESGDPIILE